MELEDSTTRRKEVIKNEEGVFDFSFMFVGDASVL